MNFQNVKPISQIREEQKTSNKARIAQLSTDKLDASEVVTTPTANKLLRLDSSAKLPADITGNSATASKLSTARTITITGDATGSASFDGSANSNIATTLANSGVTAGTYPKVTVNAKGIVTSGAPLTAADIPTLTLSKITDAGTVASKNVGTASGNIPMLDANGKLDTAVLPAIAITDTFVVNSQASMIALTAEVGDVAVRTDLNKSYILKSVPAATLANWQELLTPPNSVVSVAGKTGAVSLTASDVGLSNVTNESKATMFTSAELTGTPTAPTATAGTNTTQIATTEFVQSAVSSHTHAATDIIQDATHRFVTDDQITQWNAGGSGGTKYASNADSATTTATITHNLGTKDVIVNVYKVSTGEQMFMDIKLIDVNTITLTQSSVFGTDQYRVVIYA